MTGRILAIGDFHVPDRAAEIPLPVLNAITMAARDVPISFVACTGDLVKVTVIEPVVNTWAPDKLIVQGNMDYDSRNAIGYPRKVTFTSAKIAGGGIDLTFGMAHGHAVHPRGSHAGLATVASDMGARAIISGHTHAPEIVIHEHDDGKNYLLLNPGSATGAWSFVATMKPSFLLLDLDASEKLLRITITVHEFDADRIERAVHVVDWDGEHFTGVRDP